MLIIQIERDVYFMDIKKLKKLSSLSKDYCFYERNKKLKENHKMKKGIHYIQYRCSLKGGFTVRGHSKAPSTMLRQTECGS
jgi:hypothetical protein